MNRSLIRRRKKFRKSCLYDWWWCVYIVLLHGYPIPALLLILSTRVLYTHWYDHISLTVHRVDKRVSVTGVYFDIFQFSNYRYVHSICSFHRYSNIRYKFFIHWNMSNRHLRFSRGNKNHLKPFTCDYLSYKTLPCNLFYIVEWRFIFIKYEMFLRHKWEFGIFPYIF